MNRNKHTCLLSHLQTWNSKITYSQTCEQRPQERHNMTFIDKWSLFGGFFVFYNQQMIFEVWTLFTRWSLFRGGLSHRFDCISNLIHSQIYTFCTFPVVEHSTADQGVPGSNPTVGLYLWAQEMNLRGSIRSFELVPWGCGCLMSEQVWYFWALYVGCTQNRPGVK